MTEQMIVMSGVGSKKLRDRESRVRRLARRYGLSLVKYRGRDSRDYLFGTYMLVDAKTNFLFYGDRTTGYGSSLDEVEELVSQRLQTHLPPVAKMR